MSTYTQDNEWNESIDTPDSDCVVMYLEIPAPKVVLLQAHFELYEGLGTVRTLSIAQSLVCILTTPSLFKDCVAALNSLQSSVNWKRALRPPSTPEGDEIRQRYVGYFANAKNAS